MAGMFDDLIPGAPALPEGFVIDKPSTSEWDAFPRVKTSPAVGGRNGPPHGNVFDQFDRKPGKAPPFDPDAYLAQPPSGGGFDPDRYLEGASSGGEWDAFPAVRGNGLPPGFVIDKPGMFDDLIPKQKVEPLGVSSALASIPFVPAEVGWHGVDRKPDSGERTWLGLRTPQDLGIAPERPKNYSETLREYDKEADELIKRGWSKLTGEGAEQPSGSLENPLRSPALYDIGAGLFEGTIAPYTAAFRNYVGVPVERATGLPAEDLERAIQASLGIRGPGGGAALSRRALSPAASIPTRMHPLSPTRIAPEVDVGALERDIAARPEAVGPGDISNDGGRTWSRILPSDVPHNGRYSVGAAAAGRDALADYTAETNAGMRQFLAENGVTSPEQAEAFLDRISNHHLLGEGTRGMESLLRGLYAEDQGAARNLIHQTLAGRQAETPRRLQTAFNNNIHPNFDPNAWEADLKRRQSAESGPWWDQFTEAQVFPFEGLDALNNRLNAAGALREANRRLAIRGRPSTNGFMIPDEEGALAERRVPTTEAYQYAKEHLDSEIARALKNEEPGKARDFLDLKRDLVSAFDRHPSDDIRTIWHHARATWQLPAELQNAFNIGRDSFLTDRVKLSDVPELTRGWTDEHFDALRKGIRAGLDDRLPEMVHELEFSSRADNAATNSLTRRLLAPGNRAKLAFALREPGQADALLRAVQQEEHMYAVSNRVLNNSLTSETTAARERFRAQEAGNMLRRAADFARHPIRSALGEGLEHVAGRADTAAEHAAAEQRYEYARALTLQGAERDAYVRQLFGAEEPARPWGPRGGSPGAPAPPAPASAAPRPSPAGSSPFRPNPAAPAFEEYRGAAGHPAASRIQQMAMHGATDADIANATGVPQAQVRIIRERLGIGAHHLDIRAQADREAEKNQFRPQSPEAPLRGISPEADRVDAHFEQPGVPPAGDNFRRRMIDLVNDGATPHEADERATMELRGNAGSNRELPPLSGQARRNLLDASDPASPRGVQTGADEGQSAGAGTRQASQVAGEVHPGEAQRGAGPNQGAVERSRLQEFSSAGARRALRPETPEPEAPPPQRSLSRAEQFAALGVPEEEAARIREALQTGEPLRRERPNIPRPQLPLLPRERRMPEATAPAPERPPSRVELLARNMKGEAGEPLTRDVIERDPWGRPTRTKPLPIGKENAILEEGATRLNARAPAPESAPLKSGRFWTPEKHDRLRELVAARKTFPQIAKELGTTYSAVQQKALSLGLESQSGWGKPGLTRNSELTDKVRNLHEQGKSPAEITKSLGISRNVVAGAIRRLREAGSLPLPVEKGPPGTAASAAPGPRRVSVSAVPSLASPLEAFNPTPQELAAMRKAGLPYKHGGRVNSANIDPNPSEAQKKAGNYAKDHVSIHGLQIAVENAKGGKREGIDRNGKKWSVTMPAHYGYIKRTLGKDGDHVDVYLGPHLKSPHVYVVDQVDADSKRFDEHKAFLGFASEAQVRATYRKAFSDGRSHERLRHLTAMPVAEFKDWLENGDTTKPLEKASGGRIPGELPPSQKHSHEEVGYVSESPRKKQHCSLCTKYIPAEQGGPACKKVVQPIAPGAWCRRFVRRDGV